MREKRVESMIRLMLIAAFLHLSAMAADAQKLYAIIAADTSDYAIGGSIERDLEALDNFIDEITDGLHYDNETIYLSGERLSKGHLEKTINAFSFEADDIAIFAFFGQGGRSAKDVSAFPQIMLKARDDMELDDECFLPLESVKVMLKNKGAGLVLVLGGCGNSIMRSISPKSPIAETRQIKHDYTHKEADTLHKLFEVKGSVIVSASSKGEYAWCNNVNGSFFGQSFFRVFSDYIKSAGESSSWSDLLLKVKNDVVEKCGGASTADGMTIRQTPIYAIDLY